MSPTAKLLLGLALVALIGIGVATTTFSNRPTYVALGTFTGSDLGQVITKLNEAKIPYKPGPDGQTLLVPQADLLQARLTMNVNGLPTGGVVGQEIFNTTSLMTTQFERDENFKRAMEGELTRAIMSMDKVQSARVLLAMGVQSLFVANQQDAKASVFLQAKPGQQLSQDEVRSIMLTVSGAITGLKPENVIVTDGNHVLSSASAVGNNDTALAASQLEYQNQYQNLLQEKLQHQLEAAYGFNNVAVNVAAALDFTKMSQETQTYTSPVPLSTQTTRQSATSPGGTSTTGSTTPGSGFPTYGAGGGNNQGGTVDNTTVTVNNLVPGTKTQTTSAPGTTLKSLAVTVVVNSDKVPTTDMAQVQAAVQAFAAGIAGGVAPQVSVTAVKFNTDLVALANQPQPTPAAKPFPWLYVGVGAVALGVLMAILLLRRKPEAGVGEPAFAGGMPGGVTAGSALELLAAAAQNEAQPQGPKSPAERLLELQNKAELLGEDFLNQLGIDPTKQKLREEVEALARDNPDKVASLLKTWIAEE